MENKKYLFYLLENMNLKELQELLLLVIPKINFIKELNKYKEMNKKSQRIFKKNGLIHTKYKETRTNPMKKIVDSRLNEVIYVKANIPMKCYTSYELQWLLS